MDTHISIRKLLFISMKIHPYKDFVVLGVLLARTTAHFRSRSLHLLIELFTRIVSYSSLLDNFVRAKVMYRDCSKLVFDFTTGRQLVQPPISDQEVCNF